MSDQVDDFLAHFGVKGMKWGVRREKDEINTVDRSIKSGTTIQNISSREYKKSDRHMYAAYTSYDKASYGDMMANFMYNGKGYKNEFVLKKEIKLPSDRKLTDEFSKFARANPEQVSKDMARAYNQLHVLSSRTPRYYEKKISALDPTVRASGEKLTKDFISSMASVKLKGSRVAFFGHMARQGYNAISDVNDRDSANGTQDPLIIFNPGKTLGKVKSVKLTRDDLKRYDQMVTFNRTFKKSRTNLNEVFR